MSNKAELRDRLVDLGGRNMKMNNQLDDMEQVSNETYEQGLRNLHELKKQDEVIDRTLQKNDQIAYTNRRVEKITDQMRNRQYYINLLLYILAFILFVAILVLLGVRLSKKF